MPPKQQLTLLTLIDSMSQTIIDLIDQLKPRRQSSHNSRKESSSSVSSMIEQIDSDQYSPEDDCTSPYGWSYKQSQMFQKLLKVYGADFTILQNHLPGFSRKQIKKKFDKMEKKKEVKKAMLEGMKRDQEKKSIFEQDVLQIASEETKAILQSKSKQKQPYK